MAAEIHGEGSYFYPKLEKVFKTLNSVSQRVGSF